MFNQQEIRGNVHIQCMFLINALIYMYDLFCYSFHLENFHWINCHFCVACEAWSTHRDHDSVGVVSGVTILVSDRLLLKGCTNFIQTLKTDRASLNTGHVRKGGGKLQNFDLVMALFYLDFG